MEDLSNTPNASEDLSQHTEQPQAIDTAGPSEDKPEPKPEPKLSRSDAVKKAVDDALKSSEDDTKKEEPKKVEAKPEPEEKPAKERAPDGKFAAKVEEQPQEQPKPRQTAHREAPARFDDAAKSEWESVPEGTRGAIHRAIKEMEGGIEKHRAPAERYERTFREFDELAYRHGVDAKQALQQYVRLDQTLKQDPIRGLEEIVAAQGLRGSNGQPVTLRDIAAHILGQTPDQNASRASAENMQLRQQLAQLQQQLGGVTQFMQTQQHQTAQQAAVSEWEAFVAENEHATALENDIAEFLHSFKFGDNVTSKDKLAKAYAYAMSQHPELTTAAHTSTFEAPLAQTQEAPPKQPNPAGLKSIKGAPSGESRTAPQRKVSRDEAIKTAMRKLGVA